jgi:hypothetical protein
MNGRIVELWFSFVTFSLVGYRQRMSRIDGEGQIIEEFVNVTSMKRSRRVSAERGILHGHGMVDLDPHTGSSETFRCYCL